MKKQIIINIDGNEVGFSTKGNVTYNDITEIMGTVQLSAFKSVVESAAKGLTDTQLEALAEELWERYNGTASNILDEMIPAHMRKDLTEEAIYKLENKILKY